MSNRLQLSGLRGFYLLWLSQFISIFATRMTAFAITIWAWDLTGSTTALVLVGFTTFIPIAVLGPFAGTLVDRIDRKMVIAMSDGASALATGFLLVLFVTDQAQVLHLYVAGAFSGIFGALQYPADAAVISSMVPKQHLARANSMRSLIQSASGIGAPLLAGILLVSVGIPGILIIDLATFLLAISALAFVAIPRPKPESDTGTAGGGFLHDLAKGFRYVFERRSLLSLFILLVFVNISTGFEYPLISPLVLARTGNDATVLGVVSSAGSAGFLAGGLFMTAWGGTRKKIHGVLGGLILTGAAGAFTMGAGRSVIPWAAGAFLLSFFNPVINASYMAIIQGKVPQAIQGRVLGVETLFSTPSFPLAQLAAGLLADRVLEPASAASRSGPWIWDGIVGDGPGAGIGLLVLVGGLISIGCGVAGYLILSIREMETILPESGPQDDVPHP